jgi:uncharacterized protein
MKSRGFDPFRLDIQTFAKEEGRLEGAWPLRDLARVVDSAHSDALPTAEDLVQWAVHGETRRVRGAEPETWLHLKAGAHLSMVCQRCLQPVPLEIAAHRNFRFVAGEEAATELDADCEDDVLAMVRSLDLRPLIEDELLLSLPLVPMHASCPLPLQVLPQADSVVEDESPHPFAALAALKGRNPGGLG